MRKKRHLLRTIAVLLMSAGILVCILEYGKNQNGQPESFEPKQSKAQGADTENAETENLILTASDPETPDPEMSDTEAAVSELDQADEFYITEITDELFAGMQGKSYKDDCTVPREKLRYVHILHKDLDGNTKEGELVVNERIAGDVLEIFKELYEADYPIEKVRLIDEYDADDEASMRDNNTSAFNFRFISHTTKVSKHGEGLAVDVNTLYNPCVKEVNGQAVVEPETALPYVDRTADFPYKIDRDDLCCRLFAEHGFVWGGDWETRKDYQHFEMPDTED